MIVYEIHKEGCTCFSEYEEDDYSDDVVYIAANKDVVNLLIKKLATNFLWDRALRYLEVWPYEIREQNGFIKVRAEVECGAWMSFYAKEVTVMDHLDGPVNLPAIEALQKCADECICREFSNEDIEAYIRKMEVE